MKIGIEDMNLLKEVNHMRKKILFVTKGCDQCDEGFSYVLEFAKTLNKDIEVLIMQPKYHTGLMEDILSAVAYAEEGDLKSMQEVLHSRQSECIETLEEKIMALKVNSDKSSADLVFHAADGDVASAVDTLLKDRPYLDMILISPILSEKTTPLNIKKMWKKISRPIVHISRPVAAGI